MGKSSSKSSAATAAQKGTPRDTDGGAKQEASNKLQRRPNSTRETAESVLVAFILAFLFRAFEAEAFVIPTGSMAPTLMGRHKDIDCSQCRFKYQVGASYEVDDWEYLHARMRTAICPNCKHEMPAEEVERLAPFRGDRILVNKFPFEFGDPDRWDVVVFKFPEDPKISYIKRLVGLPGETLKIIQGDVYRKVDGKWKILRKDDPDKQKLLQILVYDNDYPEVKLHEAGWPQRWASVRDTGDERSGVAGWSDDENGWVADIAERSFQLSAEGNGEHDHSWIRYRHFVPKKSDWNAALSGQPVDAPHAELVTDFCGYNASTTSAARGPVDHGLYWVGDLTVSFDVEVSDVSAGGEMLIELSEGSRKYRCRIDLSSGSATLYSIQSTFDESEEKAMATAETGVNGPGEYHLRFANVDDRICLWVDDEVIEFDKPTEYDNYPQWDPTLPRRGDLTPVGIAGKQASLRVSHLQLGRDIYYRGEFIDPRNQYYKDHHSDHREYTANESVLRGLVTDPEKWGEQYGSYLLRDKEDVDENAYVFELGPDEFFMMGDNSPSSKDSRLWSNSRKHKHRHAVPRSALVGKAFFVYWPHGVPFMNDGQGFAIDVPPVDRFFFHKKYRLDEMGRRSGAELTDYPSFTVPFYPQVQRMHRIR